MGRYCALALGTLLLLSGCVNPYTRWYQDLSGGVNVLSDPRIIPPVGDPRIVQGSDVTVDSKEMLRNGYLQIGESAFNAAEVDDALALQHGRIVHAEVALLYKRYTETYTGLTWDDTSGDTYHVRRYDYRATYWVRMRPLALGVCVRDPNEEERRRMGSNKGAVIMVVVRGSPAFLNDILEGDIVKEINGQEVADADRFQELLDAAKAQYPVASDSGTSASPPPTAGTEVSLSILRDGNRFPKVIRLRD